MVRDTAERRPGIGEDGPGGGDHLWRRPMVVVESEHDGAREEVGEPVEERGVGPVPAVDGLSGVADHEEIGPSSEPGREQAPLGRIHVLELVDEQVPDAPPGGGGRGPVLFEHRRPRGATRSSQVEHPVASLVLPA